MKINTIPAFNIAATYFLFSLLWILFSDFILIIFLDNLEQYHYLTTLKGIFFVAFSALLIYWLSNKELKKLKSAYKKIAIYNKEKAKSSAELIIANKELAFQSEEKDKRAAELIIANKELAFQNKAKEKRAAELIIANKELAIQSKDKEKRAAELIIANKELAIQNEAKEKRAAELIIANKELAFQNEEKEKRAAELIIANKELAFQNKEKKKRAAELIIANKEIDILEKYDILTGLNNRNEFDHVLEKLEKDKSMFSVILMDINGLKIINELFGYDTGDVAILFIRDILKTHVPSQHFIARLGGDEFVIIGFDTTLNDIKELADTLLNRINDVNFRGLDISVAIGFSSSEDNDLTPYQVITDAENQMQQHKLLEADSSSNAIIAYIKTSLFERSDETEEHGTRMADLCERLGEKMGLSFATINELKLLAILHDIGKIGINDSILKKQGKLTKLEYEQMKLHSTIGFKMATGIPLLASIAYPILTHHEWHNGKGYPNQLKGDKIPLVSRILSVVDAYDAMTNERIYRKPFSIGKAINELREGSGTQFDPMIIEHFVPLISET